MIIIAIINITITMMIIIITIIIAITIFNLLQSLQTLNEHDVGFRWKWFTKWVHGLHAISTFHYLQSINPNKIQRLSNTNYIMYIYICILCIYLYIYIHRYIENMFLSGGISTTFIIQKLQPIRHLWRLHCSLLVRSFRKASSGKSLLSCSNKCNECKSHGISSTILFMHIYRHLLYICILYIVLYTYVSTISYICCTWTCEKWMERCVAVMHVCHTTKYDMLILETMSC